MVEKKLLEKIREDYLTANQGAPVDAVNAFCEFANGWLEKNGPTGVGYTVDGLTLRFANGDNFVIVASPSTASFGTAVSVTGGAEKISGRGMVDKASDFPITGR